MRGVCPSTGVNGNEAGVLRDLCEERAPSGAWLSKVSHVPCEKHMGGLV